MWFEERKIEFSVNRGGWCIAVTDCHRQQDCESMSRIDVFVNSLDEVVVNNSIKELWVWSIWLILIWLRDMQMDAGILFFF